MNHHAHFGALRALLHQPPSAQAWAQLCKVVREVPPQAYTDQIEPYCEAQLRGWPDRLRVTPRAWVRALMRGKGFAQIRLCRTLDLSRYAITSEHLTMLPVGGRIGVAVRQIEQCRDFDGMQVFDPEEVAGIEGHRIPVAVPLRL